MAIRLSEPKRKHCLPGGFKRVVILRYSPRRKVERKGVDWGARTGVAYDVEDIGRLTDNKVYRGYEETERGSTKHPYTENTSVRSVREREKKWVTTHLME